MRTFKKGIHTENMGFLSINQSAMVSFMVEASFLQLWAKLAQGLGRTEEGASRLHSLMLVLWGFPTLLPFRFLTIPLFDPEVQLWVQLRGGHAETPPG